MLGCHVSYSVFCSFVDLIFCFFGHQSRMAISTGNQRKSGRRGNTEIRWDLICVSVQLQHIQIDRGKENWLSFVGSGGRARVFRTNPESADCLFRWGAQISLEGEKWNMVPSQEQENISISSLGRMRPPGGVLCVGAHLQPHLWGKM